MKRVLPLFILGAMVLAACGAPQTRASDAPQETIVITDALDRQVSLPAAPRRIAIIGKALFMIADAAYIFPEAAARIVGLGDVGQGTSNFIALIDPNYTSKAILAEAGAEQVAALQPDLVILKSYLAETVGTPIEAIGIPVVYVDFETPEQYARVLAIFGQVFQNPERAAEAANYYQEKISQIQGAIAGEVAKARVLVLYHNAQDGKVAFNVPPAAWIQTRMVEIAGGDPIWTEASLGNNWTQVTLEQIAAWDADQIFIIAYHQDSTDIVAALKADPTWQALRATQIDQLYAFPGDLYSWDQPDTRWLLGLTWLAGKLHPESFPSLDMIEETRTFYQTLYGLNADFFETHIRPAFTGDLP